MQAIVLRGQLQLELAVTRLLAIKQKAQIGTLDRMSFARKIEIAAKGKLMCKHVAALHGGAASAFIDYEFSGTRMALPA